MVSIAERPYQRQAGSARINVTLRSVRATIVAVEIVLNIPSVCLYSCRSYPACNVHLCCAAIYCPLWPVCMYHIIPHYLITGTISEKKNTEHKMCFDFLYTFYLKHFSFLHEFSEMLSEIYIRLHVKYPLSLSDFNQT
jgi:hypothetical protein